MFSRFRFGLPMPMILLVLLWMSVSAQQNWRKEPLLQIVSMHMEYGGSERAPSIDDDSSPTDLVVKQEPALVICYITQYLTQYLTLFTVTNHVQSLLVRYPMVGHRY